MHLFQVIDFIKLWRTQWNNEQNIRKIQEEKMKKLINHAYQNVPYYKKLFDSQKITPDDIQTIGDLDIIPQSTKSQLQDLPLSQKTAQNIDIQKCKSFMTSGTTGYPLKVYYTNMDWTLINLNLARIFLASGMHPWNKIGAFVGRKSPQKNKSWYEYLGLWRGIDISSWENPDEWIKKILRWQPQILIGYVMTLKLLAEEILEKEIDDIKPKIIFSGSGVLEDKIRQFLKSIFKCKIVDLYGSYEAGYIAWECQKCSGYHISADTGILEILKNGKPAAPGEEGEVVITNFHSTAMPLIRYRQDDVAVLSDRAPTCGRGFPLLEKILGRMDDCIILKDKRKIMSQPFYYAIESISGIKRWRLVQESIHRIKIELVPQKAFKKSSISAIEKAVKAITGEDIEIGVHIVDSIPTTASTKFRQVSSKILDNDSLKI